MLNKARETTQIYSGGGVKIVIFFFNYQNKFDNRSHRGKKFCGSMNLFNLYIFFLLRHTTFGVGGIIAYAPFQEAAEISRGHNEVSGL